jgi:hypothetical protein
MKNATGQTSTILMCGESGADAPAGRKYFLDPTRSFRLW